MTLDQLRRVHSARPFESFLLRLVDGREYRVGHPEFVAISPGGRIAVVESENAFAITDLRLVTSIHVGNGGKPTRRRNSK